MGSELSELPLHCSLASLGPPGALFHRSPGGDGDEDHAHQSACTHPARRSRCSCPLCWCKWRSPGTPFPVRTHRYLPRQCSVAPGEIPRPGSRGCPGFPVAMVSPCHLSSAARHPSGQLGRGRSRCASHSPHRGSIPVRRGPEGPGRRDPSSRPRTCRLPAGKGTVILA